MAGYGYGEEFGQIYGLRFFRKNHVTRFSSSSAGRIIYEQQGVFLYNGFKGGPCFREDERGTWLVGVASIGLDRELAFTSTRPYQEWVLAEIQRASEHSRSSSVFRGSP